MAVLRIRRTNNRYPDWLRKYALFVDGQPVGRLRRGQELEVGVAPGRHEVVAKIDWCSSNTLTLDVQAGDARTLEVGSNLTGARLLAMRSVIRDQPEEYLYLCET